MMTITLYKADGSIAQHDEIPDSEQITATDAELDEMICLINGGMRACDAAALVKASS